MHVRVHMHVPPTECPPSFVRLNVEPRRYITAEYEQLAAARPHVLFFDPWELLIESGSTRTCGMLLPGTSDVFAYRDDNHLSQFGSLFLAPFLHCFLAEHGLV